MDDRIRLLQLALLAHVVRQLGLLNGLVATTNQLTPEWQEQVLELQASGLDLTRQVNDAIADAAADAAAGEGWRGD